jgi:hypothetical protein
MNQYQLSHSSVAYMRIPEAEEFPEPQHWEYGTYQHRLQIISLYSFAQVLI